VTPYAQRQIWLKESYDFKCSCVACANQFPVDLIRKDREFRSPSIVLMSSVASSLDELTHNNKYIQEKFEKDFPSFEIDELTERNIVNVGCIVSEAMKFKA
jgi:hypothetical protein